MAWEAWLFLGLIHFVLNIWAGFYMGLNVFTDEQARDWGIRYNWQMVLWIACLLTFGFYMWVVWLIYSIVAGIPKVSLSWFNWLTREVKWEDDK